MHLTFAHNFNFNAFFLETSETFRGSEWSWADSWFILGYFGWSIKNPLNSSLISWYHLFINLLKKMLHCSVYDPFYSPALEQRFTFITASVSGHWKNGACCRNDCSNCQEGSQQPSFLKYPRKGKYQNRHWSKFNAI